MEVATCQTRCQALNIFSLLSHEHHKLLQNPNCSEKKLRIQEYNQFLHSHRNTNVLSINTPWFPGQPPRSKQDQLHCPQEPVPWQSAWLPVSSDIRGIRTNSPSSASLPVHFEAAISFLRSSSGEEDLLLPPSAPGIILESHASVITSIFCSSRLPYQTPFPKQHTHMHSFYNLKRAEKCPLDPPSRPLLLTETSFLQRSAHILTPLPSPSLAAKLL